MHAGKVGLKVTMTGVKTGASSDSWRDRVPDFRSCNTVTAGAE